VAPGSPAVEQAVREDATSIDPRMTAALRIEPSFPLIGFDDCRKHG